MNINPEDSQSFFSSPAYPQYSKLITINGGVTTYTTPSGTGSTKTSVFGDPATAYSRVDWPQYYPDLEPYGALIPKVDGPQVTITTKQLEDLNKSTTAIRYDADKADWSLMPWGAVEEINKVLAFGAQKYAAHNWQQGEGFRYTRVLNSLLRHVFAYMRGEDNDPESGLSHIAHAGCNVLFILHYIKNKNRYKNDDRYVS